jgi:hypothetical protein
MTKPFYASVLALLFSTSVGLPNTSSFPINVETNVARQTSSEEEALKKVVELMRDTPWKLDARYRAEKGLALLLKEHRDSTISGLLAALLEGVQEKQAEHNLSIAMFYMYKRTAYSSAESRLKLIVNDYPNYSRLDEVLYQLALLQIETGRRAEAEETLQGLLSRPRLNFRVRDAWDKLEALKSMK